MPCNRLLFCGKKSKGIIAKRKIELLASHLQITGNSAASVNLVLNNSKIHDFEDGLEYYAAIEQGCTCIITDDIKDFYFSEIEVQMAKDFFEKYLVKPQ